MTSAILKWVIPVTAIAMLLAMVAFMAGMFDEKQAPGSNPAQLANVADTVAVIRQEVNLYEPVAASIQAKQSTMISSRIMARIEKVLVHAGQVVEKGQLLVELEKSDLQSRVSQANARINAVSARLTEAKQSLDRAVELRKTGVLALADLERARANFDTLGAELSATRQALLEAQASLDFASVRAPINGRIVDYFAEPGDTAQPGKPLLSLYNPTSMRVEANIREKLALPLQLGQTLDVVIPANNLQLTAEIEELVPFSNPGSRSFLVKSLLPYTPGLRPGMYAQLKIPAGTRSVLLIPPDRIASSGQLDIVWVVQRGVLERRLIRTGKQLNNQLIEVISGLDEGELLSVPNLARPQP